ncbi:hypothetical protein WJX84_005891 [Apatococcus fuscideae]|uniref:peptidylprolyl isomerase n=1 Tax=Apatococcus fuscideae TaxID=2026836 RepID=A0AAW1SP52_9CHLO
MRQIHLYWALVAAVCVTAVTAKVERPVTKLQIGVKHKPASCEAKAVPGDKLHIHYRGQLLDGTVFDESYKRGTPFSFTLGKGEVIKGWDQGINGMCVGEVRKLKIPPALAYGSRGSPPTIPADSSLIFETKLISIEGKETSSEL